VLEPEFKPIGPARRRRHECSRSFDGTRSTRVRENSAPDHRSERGWTDRFELRFKHEFPVDERLYQPIEDTVAALDDAIKRFSRGYITLMVARSGKSTTLTQTLRYAKAVGLFDTMRLCAMTRAAVVAKPHRFCMTYACRWRA